MKFVFDASSLIILYQSNLFPLIHEILIQLNGDIVILKAVEAELMSFPLDETIKSISVERIDYSPSDKFLPQLGFGERAVIEYILTQKNPAEYYCVLDDLKARNMAKQSGIQVIGLLGITGRGYEICNIKTKKILQGMWNNWNIFGFRIPKANNIGIYLNSLNKA